VNNIKKDTFTRSDIETSLKKEFPDLNKTQISEAIDVILESIIETVALDEKVEIRGFGTIKKKINKEKQVRNPKNNQLLFKDKTYKLHFKIGKTLHKKLNHISSGDDK